MGTPPVSDAELKRAVDLLHKHGGIKDVAARAGKINAKTFRYRLRIAAERGLFGETPRPAPTPLPNDLPTEEIIALRSKQFERNYAIKTARKWREIHLKTKEPVVLIFFGDPHLDDDGCNWPLLLKHIELAKLPNVYGVNVGDTTNNWAGKLVRLYAHQDLGVESARKLAKWFLCDAGIRWFCWVFGNHDQWADGGTILNLMNTEGIVMEDWQARVVATFPTGLKVPIWIAHNFKGHSQWNEMHGPLKAAKMRGGAFIYACGDTHTWGSNEGEMPDQGEIYWLLRSRGYKFIDHYASTHMFPQGKYGAACAAVIDPRADNPVDAVTCFSSPEKAIKFQAAIR